jgi:probable rRNA maturation factor
MSLSIEIEDESWNQISGLAELVTTAVSACPTGGRPIAFVLLGDAEMHALNKQWRGKDHATNVLSFPSAKMPLPEGEIAPLGDIVMAYGVVAREAAEQHKPIAHHVSHLVVHGVLHLLGYDHENDHEAELMENQERAILASLAIADPYHHEH